MKQFLRSFLTLLMLVVWASVGFAQTTVTFVAGTDKTDLKTLTKDGVTLTIGDGKLSYDTDFRCYAKKGFTVSSNNADITKIEFTCTGYGKKDYGPGKINNPSTGEYAFRGYIGTWTGLTKSVKFSNSAQVKMKKIVVTLASSKTPTTLTFQKSIFNIEEGNETTFTGQTATLKTGETELNNAITYTTSNDAMFEEYDAKVGPTTLKTGKYGTATVTAKFNGDDTYEASTATYTVNYTEKEKPATTLNFDLTTKTLNMGETFTATAALKAGETAIPGAVTYTSSKSEVATVNETTGEVSALTAGITTITATFAGTSEYKSSTASYELTVVDPNATEVTFDFSKPGDYGYEVPGSGSATNLEEGDKIQSGVITITSIKNGVTNSNTNKARFHNKGGNITFRVYANGTISLSAQAGYTITKFAFESTKGGIFTVSSGTYNSATKTWEGNAQSITLTIPNEEDATWFQTMTVTYSKVATATSLPLNETTTAEDAKALLKANLNKTVNVTINRTLVANKWNTLCLPFDVTAEQIKNILKAEGMVREYKDQTADCINFQAAETMTAGVPYLIKPTEEVKGLTFEGVKITATEGVAKGAEAGSTDENLSICGVLGAKALSTDGSELFLNAAGKFVAPAAATNTMKGFRAYFMSMLGAGAKINIDGETTGINNIETNATVNDKVYNLNGQYVGNSLNGLKKGIYVVNGKKVIK